MRPLVVTALAYQAVLALRWVPAPSTLSPVLSDLVWARNSLFPVTVRYSLPSFYFWDWEGYLWYLPNIIWALATVLLVATGFVWTSTSARLRVVWTIGAVVAAVVLQVEPTADVETVRDRESAGAILRTTLSAVPRRFEAELMSPMSAGSKYHGLRRQWRPRAREPARAAPRLCRLRSVRLRRPGTIPCRVGAPVEGTDVGGARRHVRGHHVTRRSGA